MYPRLFLAALLFILVSCSPKEGKLPTFDFSRTNFKSVELSDDLIVKQWNRVDLETPDEIFIPPYYKIIPCNSCIIAYNFDRILQFSPEGKFLKIIVRQGNGPEEVNYISDCIYDPVEEKLYWTDSFKGDDITCYNLKTDSFDTSITSHSKSGLSAIRKNGERLICFPSVFGESIQPVYTQSLDGNLISQKKQQTSTPTGPYVGIELNVFSLNDNWYYQGNFEDTLFNALTYEPVAIFSKGKELNLENAMSLMDNSLRSLRALLTTERQLFLKYIEYKILPVAEGAMEMHAARTNHYILDNNFEKALIIKSFMFSPLGEKYEGEELGQFFSNLSSYNPKYVVYFVENEDDTPTLYIGELI